jgi:hypothetical protein
LILIDFNGDSVDGGSGKLDSLLVTGQNQTLNLAQDAISGIEDIKFNPDSNNTLNVTAQSVLALSPDSDTLRVDAKGNNTVSLDAGWVETGLVDGYRVFNKDGATLQVDADINHIAMPGNSFTISDTSTAANVGSVFTSGADIITIDFGGKNYSEWGLGSIDLTGFGVEDKLIIFQGDGAAFGSSSLQAIKPDTLIKESSSFSYSTTLRGTSIRGIAYVHTILNDTIKWGNGFTHATLKSNQVHKSTGSYVSYNSSTSFVGVTHTFKSSSHNSHQILLTGLPPELPPTQFVFV